MKLMLNFFWFFSLKFISNYVKIKLFLFVFHTEPETCKILALRKSRNDLLAIYCYEYLAFYISVIVNEFLWLVFVFNSVWLNDKSCYFRSVEL